MNGGMPVYAMRLPFTRPASAPVARPAATGTMTGRSVSDGNTARAFGVCARLAAIIADNATTDPDERSMPPVRITCVTPMASRPMIETCSTITSRRCPLKRKLAPRTCQPIASNSTAMPTSTRKMPTSLDSRRVLNGRPAS